MTKAQLAIVSTNRTLTVAEQVQQLQAQAKSLAKEHVRALYGAMYELADIAKEVAGGGDVYAPGIRDLARQLAEDLESKAQTVEAISARG